MPSRAYLECRAGFAGRGTPLARATERRNRVPSRPEMKSRVGALVQRLDLADDRDAAVLEAHAEVDVGRPVRAELCAKLDHRGCRPEARGRRRDEARVVPGDAHAE